MQRIAILYLVAIGGWVWGYGVSAWSWWPAKQARELELFTEGDPEEAPTTIVEKIQNDSGGRPTRKLVEYQPTKNHPDRPYQEIDLPHRNSRRANPLVYVDPRAPARLRFIFGSFDFKNSMHGALLLDAQGKVIWRWNIHEQGLGWRIKATAERTFPHGVIVNSDGSIIFAFDNGASLQKFDRCSNRIWATRAGADHSLERDHSGQIWSISSPNKIEVFEPKNGRLVRRINMQSFMGNNPTIDPLGIRQLDYGDKWEWNEAGGSYWHPNDVEPLPKRLAHAFPQFEVGDLLISYRSINTVFVISPKTLDIKWWRSGAWRRQHDPDWQPDGTISVFDNNMHRRVSRIVKIKPTTYETSIAFDGKAEKFYTWMRGKHEFYSDGHIAISSPQQGRTFEVDKNGNVVFEFVNVYDQTHALIVSEMQGLPETFFGKEVFEPCASTKAQNVMPNLKANGSKE